MISDNIRTSSTEVFVIYNYLGLVFVTSTTIHFLCSSSVGSYNYYVRPIKRPKSSDPALLECLELGMEEYLDTIPSEQKPEFQQMLADIKARRKKVGKSSSMI
jgi:hypothetical protein